MNPNKSILDLIYANTPDLKAQMEADFKDLINQVALIYRKLPELDRRAVLDEIGKFEHKLNIAYKSEDLNLFKSGINELKDFIFKKPENIPQK